MADETQTARDRERPDRMGGGRPMPQTPEAWADWRLQTTLRALRWRVQETGRQTMVASDPALPPSMVREWRGQLQDALHGPLALRTAVVDADPDTQRQTMVEVSLVGGLRTMGERFAGRDETRAPGTRRPEGR